MADKKNEALFTRHSIASYGPYSKVLAGDNPTGPHDQKKQVSPDVPTGKRDGVLLAREQAKMLFAEFDPKTDAFFIISSNEIRALETAYYYVSEAQKLGFDVIEHKTGLLGSGKVFFPHLESAKRHAQGDLRNFVRPIRTLSLQIPNTLTSSVYNPKRIMDLTPVNWEKVHPEVINKWKQAREIIEGDDKGSWGANFYFHSAAIKSLFPEEKTTQEVFDEQFQQILKLVKWGLAKAAEANYPKNIKILGFGHENYWGTALEMYLHHHAIGNCETVAVSLDRGEVQLQRRGKWNTLIPN